MEHQDRGYLLQFNRLDYWDVRYQGLSMSVDLTAFHFDELHLYSAFFIWICSNALYIKYAYVITYFILTHPPTFPVGGNRSARRKPTTFGRALAYSFHMRNSKSPDGESNPRLRGERRSCQPLRHRSPLCRHFVVILTALVVMVTATQMISTRSFLTSSLFLTYRIYFFLLQLHKDKQNTTVLFWERGQQLE